VIVDDHAAFRRVARQLLAARGYRVMAEAGSANDAIVLVECLRPDAVLLDVRLGEECGFDVAQALVDRRPGLAVLLVSAQEEGDEEHRARESGACGFLPKNKLASVDLAELWRTADHPVGMM
jgi:two-component system nitrate/nitrite response regulator NarL